jgi:hypothetical protein
MLRLRRPWSRSTRIQSRRASMRLARIGRVESHEERALRLFRDHMFFALLLSYLVLPTITQIQFASLGNFLRLVYSFSSAEINFSAFLSPQNAFNLEIRPTCVVIHPSIVRRVPTALLLLGTPSWLQFTNACHCSGFGSCGKTSTASIRLCFKKRTSSMTYLLVSKFKCRSRALRLAAKIFRYSIYLFFGRYVIELSVLIANFYARRENWWLPPCRVFTQQDYKPNYWFFEVSFIFSYSISVFA